MFLYGLKQYHGLFLILLITLLFIAGSGKEARGQDEIKVAVATNFIPAMDEIAGRYEAETGTRIKCSSSATGILYAQIVNRAPYDLFLAADEKRPELLYQQGLCEEPFIYASGRVVLWSWRADLDETENWRRVTVRDDISRIAMANPETAPYGAATLGAMEKTGLDQKLQRRLVYGQNIGQTFQYGQQRVADLAFVALSLALSEHGRKGKTWDLPEAPPVVQQGCILKAAAAQDHAVQTAILTENLA